MTDQPADVPSPEQDRTGPPVGPGGPAGPRRRGLVPVALGAGLAVGMVGGVLISAAAGTGSAHHTSAPLTVPPHQPVPLGGKSSRPLIHLTGALVSFTGCEDYLTYIRNRAEAMVGPYGLQPYGLQAYGAYPTPVDGPVYGVATGGATGVAPAAGGTASLAPASAAASQATPAGTAYSQTNDQVAGVDEPDTVKTDGHIVVTLEGSTLRVMDATAHVLGSLQLAGDTGGGLILSGDRAVVLSSYASPGQGTTGVVQPLYGRAYPSGPQAPVTTAQLAVVDLSDPAAPQLVHTFHFDGSVVAARLVGGQVRLVLRSDGPRLNFTDPSSPGDPTTATAANKQLVEASSLGDWLPAWQLENPDGSTTARRPVTACDSIVRPDQASGISTVSILSLDPQSDAPGPGASVVAGGDVVYATADHIYVAGPDGSGTAPNAVPQQYGCCSISPPAGATTRVYEFDVPSTGVASFVGAGTVPGWLVNSYAMDEDVNGFLRVASTSVPEAVPGGASAPGMAPFGSQTVASQSQITVLQPSAGRLVTVGSVGGLGKGEYLRAVRFLGDQAYVVTFQSFDPLYVVDLADPAKPFLAGELDQPGFSEFLYPLPGHRLLGVGVELTQNEPSGLVVATYDVSDPAHPRRIDSSELTQGPQYAFGSYDPHAFLYWAPADLALLATPGGWGGYGPGAGVAAYKIGSGGGLNRAATIGHGSFTASRSVVIGSQVWVVTDAGIVTSDVNALGTMSWHPY